LEKEGNDPTICLELRWRGRYSPQPRGSSTIND
jgi:hypothetical protein